MYIHIYIYILHIGIYVHTYIHIHTGWDTQSYTYTTHTLTPSLSHTLELHRPVYFQALYLTASHTLQHTTTQSLVGVGVGVKGSQEE